LERNYIDMMAKKWIAALTFVGLLFTTVIISSQTVSANQLDKIRQQQKDKEQNLIQLENEITSTLDKIDEKNKELTQLNKEVTNSFTAIKQTEKNIADQEETVTERIEQAENRLQSMQLNESNRNIIITLLEAESLGDFIHRAYVALRLTRAGNEEIGLAKEEVQKLESLQEKIGAAHENLETKVANISDTKTQLDNDVSRLQTLVSENQTELDELVQAESQEAERIAEAERVVKKEVERRKELEEAETKRMASAKEASKTVTTSSSQTNAHNSKESKESKESKTGSKTKEESRMEKNKKESHDGKNSDPKQKSGRTISVQATGYSTQQPGLSTHTYLGMDLRSNPNVIAVDPDVIPLGSTVHIEGLGTYIAGDTGSAINGNIIDVHFPTVSQALNWGRRNVQITILN